METITYYIENNLLIGANLILYAIGSHIQIKVISTCRKEKDKVCQITITNSITMMILFSFGMIFENVTSHVPVMSQYTGEWICFVEAFIYIYSWAPICYKSFIHFLITIGCTTNGDCSGATDTCTAGQCKCGANDMCLWEWRVRNGKCSLGQCEDW